MARSEILKILVLGLMLLVCRSAQSYETGYRYDTDYVADYFVYDDLRCTYMFGGLTHVLILKRYSGDPLLFNINAARSQIAKYNRISVYEIDSLYRLKVTHMGALWILHLYSIMAHGFYINSSNKEEAGQKMMSSLDYVITQLRGDLTRYCRGGNSFDNYDTLIYLNPSPTLEDLQDWLEANYNKVKRMLNKNGICGLFGFYDGKTLHSKHLFLNNLGYDEDLKEDLMDAFNVQVEWSSTREILKKSWCDAHLLNWPSDLKNLRLYFELSFDFLKIIMFQLTVKHLKYLELLEVDKHLYAIYTNDWCLKVKLFGDTLGLSNELHVTDLLSYLKNIDVNRNETIEHAVNYSKSILEILCRPFGCVATNEIELNYNEFKKPFKSIIDTDTLYLLKITVSHGHIEYHSLENARVFLYYLISMFKNVDIALVRSLMEYLNEVNP